VPLDKIEQVRRHVAALEKRSREIGNAESQSDVMEEAFEDLRTTLE
jgi:hypothetical protein